MNKAIILAVVVILLAIGGFMVVNNNSQRNVTPVIPSVTNPPVQPTSIGSPTSMMSGLTVELQEQNNSSESGNATVKEKNGKVVVSVNLTGAPATAQPAHFHTGTCDKPGPIKYPLTNVVNGKSKTTLDVSMDEFKKSLPLILNVHKSPSQIQIYVACGTV